MVQFDATILIQVFNFVILLAILNAVFYQPILKLQAQRRETLDGGQSHAQSKLKEIETMEQTYHHKLDGARQEAHQLVTAQVRQAKQNRETQMQVINQETNEKFRLAREQMLSAAEQTRQSLDNEVTVLATLMLDKLSKNQAPEANA